MILYVLLFTRTWDMRQVCFAMTKVLQRTSLRVALSLDYSALQWIERERMGRIQECKLEMLSSQLQQKDVIVGIALPTWSTWNFLKKDWRVHAYWWTIKKLGSWCALLLSHLRQSFLPPKNLCNCLEMGYPFPHPQLFLNCFLFCLFFAKVLPLLTSLM